MQNSLSNGEQSTTILQHSSQSIQPPPPSPVTAPAPAPALASAPTVATAQTDDSIVNETIVENDDLCQPPPVDDQRIAVNNNSSHQEIGAAKALLDLSDRPTNEQECEPKDVSPEVARLGDFFEFFPNYNHAVNGDVGDTNRCDVKSEPEDEPEIDVVAEDATNDDSTQHNEIQDNNSLDSCDSPDQMHQKAQFDSNSLGESKLYDLDSQKAIQSSLEEIKYDPMGGDMGMFYLPNGSSSAGATMHDMSKSMSAAHYATAGPYMVSGHNATTSHMSMDYTMYSTSEYDPYYGQYYSQQYGNYANYDPTTATGLATNVGNYENTYCDHYGNKLSTAPSYCNIETSDTTGSTTMQTVLGAHETMYQISNSGYVNYPLVDISNGGQQAQPSPAQLHGGANVLNENEPIAVYSVDGGGGQPQSSANNVSVNKTTEATASAMMEMEVEDYHMREDSIYMEDKENLAELMSNEEMQRINSKYTHQRFPIKLWNLASDDEFKPIKWSSCGTSLIIDELVLEPSLGYFFRSKKFSSFLRQLHLYGFRKVTRARNHRSTTNNGMHRVNEEKTRQDYISEYQCQHFQRDRFDLVKHVRRFYGSPACSSLSTVNNGLGSGGGGGRGGGVGGGDARESLSAGLTSSTNKSTSSSPSSPLAPLHMQHPQGPYSPLHPSSNCSSSVLYSVTHPHQLVTGNEMGTVMYSHYYPEESGNSSLEQQSVTSLTC